MNKISFKLDKGVALPSYATPNSAGMDLTFESVSQVWGINPYSISFIETKNKILKEQGFYMLMPSERVLVDTGIQLTSCDPDLMLQLTLRSSLGLKKGVIIPNSPGIIDADYRGKIGVILLNPTQEVIEFTRGERIAQLVPILKPTVQIIEQNEVEHTLRGSGGFGSTGK